MDIFKTLLIQNPPNLALEGQVSYQGTWDASANSPTLVSSVGTKGYYYVVSTSGSTNLNGVTTWTVGDWAIFNGSVWQKVDNTDAITSISGTANQISASSSTGDVVLSLPPQIAISGQSLTGSSATSLLDLSTTWNTTGNPTAIKLNVTNTASGSTSNLLDLQVGGVSAFRVAKNGITTFAKLVNTETRLSLVGTRDYNLISGGGGGYGAGNFVISDQSLGYDVLNVSPGSSGPSTRLQFDSAGNAQFNAQLKTASTTASSSTSTGALVVSGGVGVAGAASIGGPILVGTSSDVYVSRVGTGILDIRSASSPGTTARLDVTGTTSAGVGFRQSGTRDWFISAESGELRVSCLTAASIFAFNSGTPVAMRDTTDSSSTTTGALVVSGGLGVAKTITAGGVIVKKAYTVATLPAAASYTYGTCAVSDATNAAGTGLGTSPTGGGSVKRMVYSDGSNWLLL